MVKDIIYVKLLDEGSITYRPVSSLRISDNIYIIDGNEVYDPDDESWEFLPGEEVFVNEIITANGENILVAVKENFKNL